MFLSDFEQHLAEEGLASLPGVKYRMVDTPCGSYPGLELPPEDQIAVVSIVRAGDTLLEAVRRARPGIAVGKILIQRDEEDPGKRPKVRMLHNLQHFSLHC